MQRFFSPKGCLAAILSILMLGSLGLAQTGSPQDWQPFFSDGFAVFYQNEATHGYHSDSLIYQTNGFQQWPNRIDAGPYPYPNSSPNHSYYLKNQPNWVGGWIEVDTSSHTAEILTQQGDTFFLPYQLQIGQRALALQFPSGNELWLEVDSSGLGMQLDPNDSVKRYRVEIMQNGQPLPSHHLHGFTFQLSKYHGLIQSIPFDYLADSLTAAWDLFEILPLKGLRKGSRSLGTPWPHDLEIYDFYPGERYQATRFTRFAQGFFNRTILSRDTLNQLVNFTIEECKLVIDPDYDNYRPMRSQETQSFSLPIGENYTYLPDRLSLKDGLWYRSYQTDHFTGFSPASQVDRPTINLDFLSNCISQIGDTFLIESCPYTITSAVYAKGLGVIHDQWKSISPSHFDYYDVTYWEKRDTTFGDSSAVPYCPGIPPNLTLTPPMDSLIAVAPNPSNGATTLFLSVGSYEGVLEASLYDVRGKRVRVVSPEVFERGNHSFFLDLGTLRPGIYYLRGKIGEKSFMQKLLIRLP